MSDDNTTTTTGTTTDPAAPAHDATGAAAPPRAGLHELSKTDRDAFYSTGKLPDKKTDSDAAADSSPAPAEGEKAAETAASSTPASEPGKPAKDKKARNSEESRVSELLEDRRRDRELHTRLQRDNDDLRTRLEALEKPKADGKKPDSSTAADPSAPEWSKYRNLPGAPKIDDFTGENSLEEFIEAKAFFIAKQIAREEATGVFSERETQHAETAAAERELETAINEAATRLEAEEKAFPDLVAKVHPKLRALLPARLLPPGQKPGPQHFAKDLITFESEHRLQLHAFYSSDEGLAEWRSMMTMPPKQIERTILARDLSFRSSPQGDGSPGAAASKTFTKTPPPPEQSGKKPAQVGDAADKAVKKGDFAGFMREMDDREGVTSRYSRNRG